MKSICLCMLCNQRKQWVVVNQFHSWCSCKALIPNSDKKMHSKKVMQLRMDVCVVCVHDALKESSDLLQSANTWLCSCFCKP
jgi:hypothetical protein